MTRSVLDRGCGSCSMCCKVMEITELKKPVGMWCSYVAKGKGCTIYDDRPPTCAGFVCGYLRWDEAGDHWLPSKAKMVIVFEDEQRMAVHVDASTPNVWKSEPYYDDLKRWAWLATQNDQQIVVMVGRRMIAILPDREVDLGIVMANEVVVTTQRANGTIEMEKISVDNPRLPDLVAKLKNQN